MIIIILQDWWIRGTIISMVVIVEPTVRLPTTYSYNVQRCNDGHSTDKPAESRNDDPEITTQYLSSGIGLFRDPVDVLGNVHSPAIYFC
jgi:hypothetical protein